MTRTNKLRLHGSVGAASTILMLLATTNLPAAETSVDDVAGSKPNLIVIFVDDMGYGDPGCFGSTKNRTPLMLRPGKAKSPHDAFYYYFMSQLQAVRAGKWKLHLELDPRIGKWMGTPQGTTEKRLHNLETDPAEETNVAADHPEVVRRLEALAEIARKEIGDYQKPGTGRREPGYVENPVFLRMEGE